MQRVRMPALPTARQPEDSQPPSVRMLTATHAKINFFSLIRAEGSSQADHITMKRISSGKQKQQQMEPGPTKVTVNA